MLIVNKEKNPNKLASCMPAEVPIGRYLSSRWAEIGINQAEFSRRIAKLPAYVQQVRVGKRKPPLRAHAKWLRALELDSAAASARLLELMQLGHALPVTQESYERMRVELQGAPEKTTHNR